MVRDNLVRDKYNVGEGLLYLAAFVHSTSYDAVLEREVLQQQVSTIRPYWGQLGRTVVRGSRFAKKEAAAVRNYFRAGMPSDYKCGSCAVTGVKLWREYVTGSFCASLFCVACAEADQAASHEYGWRSPVARGTGDQIGWLVPAVPDEEGVGYWGYMSVPDAGATWWEKLPLVEKVSR